MAADNKELTARFFDEVCNARKLDVTNEIFTKDHVYHDPSSPWVGPGPEGMKQLVSAYHGGFPDAHWSVEEMFAVGDRVITRWTGGGTHQGTLSGIGPTGKPVKVAGVWIHKYANGKIVESWNVWDTLGMLQQLGVVPAIGQGASGA
jgi:steroid delta-isomerase-like uncharacterized protein